MPKLISIKRPSKTKSELLPNDNWTREQALFLKNAEQDFFKLSNLFSNLKRALKNNLAPQLDRLTDVMTRYESLEEAITSNDSKDRRIATTFLNELRNYNSIRYTIYTLLESSQVLRTLINVNALTSHLLTVNLNAI